MEAIRPDSARLVLTTVGNADQARTLARPLVERGLAACVTLVENAVSIYRWQGALQEEREILLLIKTTASRVGDLQASLSAEHPYDVPEILVFDASSGAPSYLQWLSEATQPNEERS